MINLMYIVLTAMLALNVSSDVLNGFKQVEDGLERSTSNASLQNDALYQKLAAFNSQNPEKGGQWYKKSLDVRRQTSALYNYIDSLKTVIVKKADGKDGDVNNILRQDDLEAASYIMLSPAQRQGEKLRKMIDDYRSLISGFMTDSVKRATIENYLSTSIHSGSTRVQAPSMWETTLFENMPVIAAVTILTKIQSDVRYAESEALHTLINNIDEGDVRVNQLNAFVIPNSKNIMRGGKYSSFEAGTCVPTLVRWPGHTPRNRTSAAALSQIDLFASLAALTGTELNEGEAPDSRNELSAWLGKDKQGREYVIEKASAASVLQGPWKYIEPNGGAKKDHYTNTELGNDKQPQLYRLDTDPGERNNVAAQYPDKTAELSFLLETVKNRNDNVPFRNGRNR